MTIESIKSDNIDSIESKNDKLISKSLGRNWKKAIPCEDIKGDEYKQLSDFLANGNDKNQNPDIIRQRFQKANELLNTGRTISEVLTILKDENYINNEVVELGLDDEQKIKLTEDLKTIGVNNSTIILDLLKNNESDEQDAAFILLDTLIWIKNEKGQILNKNVKLRDGGVERLNRLYPDMNTDSLTIDWIVKNLGGDSIGLAIKSALNERILSNLKSEDKTNFGNLIKGIKNKENEGILSTFLDYYNYEQLYEKEGKSISIDNLWGGNTEIIKSALKIWGYCNGFSIVLTEKEQEDVNKKRKQKWRERRRNLIERINNRSKNRNRLEIPTKTGDSSESISYDNRSGQEIASSLNIGNILLEKFPANTDEIDINDPRVFRLARENLYNANRLLHNKLPKNYTLIRKLYDETNRFSDFSLNHETVNKLNYICDDDGEFENVCSVLGGFYNYLSEAQKKISSLHSKLINLNNADTNNKAIGSVIDGVRDIFSNLGDQNNIDKKSCGFQLDQKSPAKLDDDGTGLIIKGTFNGEDVNIKYDLISGNVYMNTCITELAAGGTIIFGKKDATFCIGTIENFNSLIDDYNSQEMGNKPQNRAEKKKNHEIVLNNQIQNIGKLIETQLSTNQIKNETSTNFLKTFGLIDDNTNGEIQFEAGSDAYKVIQIINNSSKENIYNFSKYMVSIAKYAGKIWGSDQQDFNSEEYKNISYRIENPGKLESVDITNEYPILKSFLEKLKSSNMYEGQKGKIDQSYKNGLISMIYENFVDGNAPDRKLDENKIKTFVDKLKDQCNNAGLSLSLMNAGI